MNSELHIPPAALAADPAVEIMRLWVVRGKGQHITLRHDVWEDPAAWGMMLVDIARHVAKAYAGDGKPEAAALARIYEGLAAEMKSPSDTPVEDEKT
jgi:hypothetical protein